MATSFTTHSEGQVILSADINLIQTAVNALENAGINDATRPTNSGLISWHFDPFHYVVGAGGSGRMLTGQLHIMAVDVHAAATTTNLTVVVSTAGSSITAGQAFGALYDSAGTRVAVTAAMDTTWNSTGLKTVAWVTPAALTPGRYWVGLMSAGATLPAFYGKFSAAPAANEVLLFNAGTTVSNTRYGLNGSGLTSAPTSITPASNTAPTTAWAYWAAIS